MSRAYTTTMAAIGSAAVVASIAALQYDLTSLLPQDPAPPAEVARLIAPPSKPLQAAAGAESTVSDLVKELTRAADGPLAGFDVVRINPEGASVLAGRAAPNEPVTVMANGKAVVTVKANESGEWAAVTDHKFTPGRTELSLQAKAADQSAPMRSQVVSVDVAAAPAPVATSPAAKAPPPTRVADAAAAARPGAGKSVRDIKPVAAVVTPAAPAGAASAPTPITFVYREPTFTDDGRKAAQILADFLKDQKLDAITLSGHADERGTPQHNMELSRQRLDSVAQLLRQAGYNGRMVLIPKGESEPFAGVDRRRLDKEQLYQLDRRVELRAR